MTIGASPLVRTDGVGAVAVVEDGRGNRLVIDEAAFGANVAKARRMVGDAVRLMQVVKGDGYGLGLERVVAMGLSAGVDGFCAGTPREAVRIKAVAPTATVLLFTACAPDKLPALLRRGIVVTINSREALQALIRSGSGGDVFLELDCGFGRFGLDEGSLWQVLDLCLAHGRLTVTGAYTHFGQSDDRRLDDGLQTFDRSVATIRKAIRTPIAAMVASTHTILLRPSLPYEAVDPGRLLYGIVDPASNSAALQPVLSAVVSRLIQINRIEAAQRVTIGYGAVADLPVGGRTGVFPLGWYDGLPVRGGLGEVLVRGRRARIIARTLLHSVVDLSATKDAEVGDDVVLVGAQGHERLDIDEVAGALGTSPTELHFLLGRAITAPP